MAGLISKEVCNSGHRDLVSESSGSRLLAGAGGAGRGGAAIRTGNGLNNTFEIVCLVVTAPAHHHYTTPVWAQQPATEQPQSVFIEKPSDHVDITSSACCIDKTFDKTNGIYSNIRRTRLD